MVVPEAAAISLPFQISPTRTSITTARVKKDPKNVVRVVQIQHLGQSVSELGGQRLAPFSTQSPDLSLLLLFGLSCPWRPKSRNILRCNRGSGSTPPFWGSLPAPGLNTPPSVAALGPRQAEVHPQSRANLAVAKASSSSSSASSGSSRS